MRTLIIPDVHEDIATVERILKAESEPRDLTIFLGDWFDTFSKVGQLHETARFIVNHKEEDGFIFLWGNHDLQYAYPQIAALRCSGFDPAKLPVVQRAMEIARHEFKFFFQVNGWLISHAGVHPTFATSRFASFVMDCQQNLRRGRMHPIVGAGLSRGGSQPFGGLTWLDWDTEFEPVPGLHQIVGHTKHATPQWNSGNICLDTRLRHYAILEDGEVEIREVTG